MPLNLLSINNFVNLSLQNLIITFFTSSSPINLFNLSSSNTSPLLNLILEDVVVSQSNELSLGMIQTRSAGIFSNITLNGSVLNSQWLSLQMDWDSNNQTDLTMFSIMGLQVMNNTIFTNLIQ